MTATDGANAPGALTDAQLLRMPITEYMNRQQLAFFRQRLLQLKAEIAANQSTTAEHLKDTEVAADPADRATREEEQAVELRTREREHKLLRKIDEALARIEDGRYGYCDETGERIGLPRLLARPTATLSVEAQERRERRERYYGG
ncbi:MAG: RNA polymerase-binding protein DksA [Burkholderiales bacterium]